MSTRSTVRTGVLLLLNAALSNRAWAQQSPAPTSNAPAPADSAAAAHTTSAQPASPAMVEPETRPPSPLGVNHSAPRARFDLMTSTQVDFGWFHDNLTTGGIGNLGIVGLTADFGVQWGDHFALYAHAGANTMGLTSAGFAYLVAEWTPVPNFSIGTGIGWEGVMAIPFLEDWWGVSAPLSLAWNIGKVDLTKARRSVFRIGVEAAFGWGPASGRGWGPGTEGFCVHLGSTFGWAWM